jgi:AraC-like DNA-binding protein
MDLYWVHFTAQLFGCLEVFDLLNWKRSIPLPPGEEMPQLFGQFFEACHTDKLDSSLGADALLRRVLSWFVTEPAVQNERLRSVQRFLPVITYIEQNLTRPLSLGELTSVLPLQEAYFCDLFSKTMGQSPIDFVNRKRIERAQFLLTQDTRALKEIAARVGFRDVYYFSRVFKKVVGIAPAHYRRQEGLW